MLLTVCLTFVGTTLMYALLLCLILYRLARHLRGNEVGMQAVVEHVLLPVFGGSRAAPVQPVDAELEPLPNGETILRE
jgi:hypothetical protein